MAISKLKDSVFVKVIAMIILLSGIWIIGYLSGLEIGQKKAEQAFIRQNQNKNTQAEIQLPQIPEIPDNQNTGLNNQLPQIPQIK